MKFIFCLIISLLWSCSQARCTNNAVTYNLAGGRLGDQLIGYMHAKWISYRYQIPLLYKPFPYSDQLVLHDKELSYDQNVREFKKEKTLAIGQVIDDLIKSNDHNVMYVIPYFPESREEYEATSCPAHWWKRPRNFCPFFEVDWENKEFKALIKKMIKPGYALNLIWPPEDKLSIALHIRKNSGGFDLPLLHGLSPQQVNPKQVYVDVVFPWKHPPEEYFIEQLKKVLSMFPDQLIYVYMFTDDPNPQFILNNLKKAVNDSRVEFACRTTENNHYSNVLEDLFSMLNFDCLIRPDSNLAIVASKIGDYKLIISPAHHRWEGYNLIIDHVALCINGKPQILRNS